MLSTPDINLLKKWTPNNPHQIKVFIENVSCQILDISFETNYIKVKTDSEYIKQKLFDIDEEGGWISFDQLSKVAN